MVGTVIVLYVFMQFYRNNLVVSQVCDLDAEKIYDRVGVYEGREYLYGEGTVYSIKREEL